MRDGLCQLAMVSVHISKRKKGVLTKTRFFVNKGGGPMELGVVQSAQKLGFLNIRPK